MPIDPPSIASVPPETTPPRTSSPAAISTSSPSPPPVTLSAVMGRVMVMLSPAEISIEPPPLAPPDASTVWSISPVTSIRPPCVIEPLLTMVIVPPSLISPFGRTKSPRASSCAVASVVTSPTFSIVTKPVPIISNGRSSVSVRPPRSNRHPPVVTSIASLTVTDVALHGPLVGAQRMDAVLSSASVPQLRDTARTPDGRAATFSSTSCRRGTCRRRARGLS